MSKLKISLLFPIVFISVFGFLFSFSVQETWAVVIQSQVASSNDDAWEDARGAIGSYGEVHLTSSTVNIKEDYSPDPDERYIGGFRWVVSIPKGSIINTAYASFYIPSSTYDDAVVELRFQNSSNPPPFQTVASNLSGRSKVSGDVDWEEWALGTGWVNTPSLVPQLQTLANNYDITALVLLTERLGSTNTDAELRVTSYDGNSTRAAKLYVDYTSPASAPAVTTDNATISSTQLQNEKANLNGEIDSTGGESCDKRGFVYGATSIPSGPGNVAPGSSGYDSYVEDSGSYEAGPFTKERSLSVGNIMYYRAYAHNSAGYSYGAEKRVVIYQASGGQQSFTTESLCKDVCESCSTGECCSGFHCQNGVCCADGQTCCTGNAHCPADSCIDSYQHIDYYCNASVCYCESSTTTCTAGGCCQIACSSATGCYTTAGTCPESCGTNTLVMGQTCSGCGANGATGSCGGGTTYACNATTHTECQSASCGGATYYCTQDGGTWQWRTSDNPDRCGGNSDGCYDDYDNGCQIKDFRCSAGACTFTPSNQHADTSCSYTGCSTDNCTKTGTYNNYFCDAGSCTAQSDSCSEVCGIKTACSGGVCYSDTGDGDLCNTEMKASPGEGDGNYGIGGDYNCQGSCDSSGNCDYAVNCISIDTTSPTTEIRIFDSTDTDITDTKSWLKSDNYTIKFKAIDNESGLDYYEYYIYECEEGGIPCNITIDHITGNYTGEIDIEVTKEHSMGAGKSPKKYYLEGLGRYKILFLPTDKAGNTESNPEKTTRYVNFDFTPPETWIE